MQLAASGADAYWTQKNTVGNRKASEMDPLARPFVKSTAGVCFYFAAETGAKLFVTYELNKHGHRKLARAFSIWGIGDNIYGAAYSASHGD